MICSPCAQGLHESCADISMVDSEGTLRAIASCDCFHSPDVVRAWGHYASLGTDLHAGNLDSVARHCHAILALVAPKPKGVRRLAVVRRPPPFDVALEELAAGESTADRYAAAHEIEP